MLELCYICLVDKQIDSHHIDCREGKLSPETVPFCRRCHRTYHDLGVEWFDDEYLDKTIEVENKRRQIVYAHLLNSVEEPSQVKPLQLLKREDIKRSDYWNKIHGVLPKRKRVKEPVEQLTLPIEVGEGKTYPMNTPQLF